MHSKIHNFKSDHQRALKTLCECRYVSQSIGLPNSTNLPRLVYVRPFGAKILQHVSQGEKTLFKGLYRDYMGAISKGLVGTVYQEF